MRGHGRGHTIIVRNVPTDFLPFCSLRLGAGVHHAKAVERGPGGDEQCLKISPAKADVGRSLRNGDLLELLAVGIEDVHLAAMGRVEDPLHVDSHPLAALIDLEKLLAKLSIGAHRVAADAVGELVEFRIRVPPVPARVGDINTLFIR